MIVFRLSSYFQFCITSIFLALSVFQPFEANASIIVDWEAPDFNTDETQITDFSHYLVKLGIGEGASYDSSMTVTEPYFAFSNLASGKYRVAVTAVDTFGNESEESSQISFMVVDGALDSDGDGLSDDFENSIGTDIDSNDTDGDSVTDYREVADKTNPKDKGSHTPVHEVRVCAPWNGYLVDSHGQGMWNVFEHLNAGSADLRVATQILTPLGEVEENYSFLLPEGVQRDILVHDFRSRHQNSYGNVCSESNGAKGDLRGTMVYYKPSSLKAGFDFAIAIPATAPRKGVQYLPLNTYNPSLALKDSANVLSSWVQITNYNSTAQSGRLKFWRSDGVIIKETPVFLDQGSRVDVPMHDVGPSTTGFVEWSPSDLTAKFKLDSTRYYYDNPKSENSFEGAAFLPGFVPTGELIGSPYDTRDSSAILEISNALSAEEVVTVMAYAETGQLLFNTDISLGAKNTFHLILDGYTPGSRGLVTVQARTANAVFANMMHYKRKLDGGYYFVFANPVVPAIGNVLSSSYNTYIEHKSELLIANFGSTAINVAVDLTRLSGEKIIDSEIATIGGNALSVIEINSREVADQYGVVRATGTLDAKIAAWVFRERSLEYNLPLQLTQ